MSNSSYVLRFRKECISNEITHSYISTTEYSPEKWLHNWICHPSNRSKQIQETHTAYSADTQPTRQSLNGRQHTRLHRQLTCCLAMYVVFHSNFAACIVYRRYKPCEFLEFVWTDSWGNKSNYVITSPAN